VKYYRFALQLMGHIGKTGIGSRRKRVYVADVATVEAELQLQGGDEGDIRALNQFGARVTSASGELMVFNGDGSDEREDRSLRSR
jgi:hypothetical protein